jgi:hypothetical protein
VSSLGYGSAVLLFKPDHRRDASEDRRGYAEKNFQTAPVGNDFSYLKVWASSSLRYKAVRVV